VQQGLRLGGKLADALKRDCGCWKESLGAGWFRGHKIVSRREKMGKFGLQKNRGWGGGFEEGEDQFLRVFAAGQLRRS